MDKVLFLLLPEGATDLEVCPQWDDEVGPFYLHFYVDGEGDYRDIHEGYTILGLSTDILKSEELAEKVVPSKVVGGSRGFNSIEQEVLRYKSLKVHSDPLGMPIAQPLFNTAVEAFADSLPNPSQPYIVLVQDN